MFDWMLKYHKFAVEYDCRGLSERNVSCPGWQFCLLHDFGWLGYGRSLTCMFVCQSDECAGDVPAPVKTHHFGLHIPIGCLQTRDNQRYHGNKWCLTQRTNTRMHGHAHTDEKPITEASFLTLPENKVATAILQKKKKEKKKITCCSDEDCLCKPSSFPFTLIPT